MYKLLLCWRYLRTRYLALACIVSVMLGVATLIVVNSVMSGFSTKLRERLHSLLSDVVIEARGLEGFGDYEGKMKRIREDPILKDKVQCMAPTMEVFAMLQYRGVTRPVHLVGVDPKSRSQIGGFKEHLLRMKDAAEPSFELPPADRIRFEKEAQWKARQAAEQEERERRAKTNPNGPQLPRWPEDPPPVQVPKGIILGQLIPMVPVPGKDGTVQMGMSLDVGDTVVIITVDGQELKPVTNRLAVVDFFASEMNEYDNNFVFVPLDHLQHIRRMDGLVTSIQIKLKDYDGTSKEVVARLQELFKGDFLRIETWEQKQGSILAAISIEKGILNVLLFLIIAVAGFGILAIFSMIVTEKTRDIGILKALGASNGGVMKIFLGYGLLLGIVGAGLGSSIGVTLAVYINEIERFLTQVTGQEVFKRSVYYFKEIPVDIQPMMVVLVDIGAVLIAVLFSVLPALRAALLHPVRALRYE